jgi:hypothetical protein
MEDAEMLLLDPAMRLDREHAPCWVENSNNARIRTQQLDRTREDLIEGLV